MGSTSAAVHFVAEALKGLVWKVQLPWMRIDAPRRNYKGLVWTLLHQLFS